MLSLMSMAMMVNISSMVTPGPLVHSSSRLFLGLVAAAANTGRRNVTLVTGAAPTGVVVLRLRGVADGHVGDDIFVGAAVGFDACVAYVCCSCLFGVVLVSMMVVMVMVVKSR